MFEAIQTIKQNCRRCFTCVRDCPVKAIKIVEGQASVVSDRCIACGNCTMVCSQNAKTYASGLESTKELLESGMPVVALLAPSFPAEFPDLQPGQIVGALKNAGFHSVVEVAYGADLVQRCLSGFLRKTSGGGLDRLLLSRRERVRPQIPAGPRLAAHSHRLADDRDGDRRPGNAPRRDPVRLHRSLHRQEAGGPGPLLSCRWSTRSSPSRN